MDMNQADAAIQRGVSGFIRYPNTPTVEKTPQPNGKNSFSKSNHSDMVLQCFLVMKSCETYSGCNLIVSGKWTNNSNRAVNRAVDFTKLKEEHKNQGRVLN